MVKTKRANYFFCYHSSEKRNFGTDTIVSKRVQTNIYQETQKKMRVIENLPSSDSIRVNIQPCNSTTILLIWSVFTRMDIIIHPPILMSGNRPQCKEHEKTYRVI